MSSTTDTQLGEIAQTEPASLNNSPIAYGLGSFGLESAYKVFIGFYIFYYVDVLGLAVALVDFEQVDQAMAELDKFEGGRILRHSLSDDVYTKLSEAVED
jgi:hypothetical protein